MVFFRVFGEADVGTSGRTSKGQRSEHGEPSPDWACGSSPLQEGPVGLGHSRSLGPADEVPLLLVGDGPAFLGLTQLLQALVETLRRRSEVKAAATGAYKVGSAHLKLVLDDLPLFVLQLREEQVLARRAGAPRPSHLFLSLHHCSCSEQTTIQASSDLCAGLEGGNVPLRQMFCDFEPAGTQRSGSGQRRSEVRGQLKKPKQPYLLL